MAGVGRPHRTFRGVDPEQWDRCEMRLPVRLIVQLSEVCERFDIRRDQVVAEILATYLEHYIERRTEGG